MNSAEFIKYITTPLTKEEMQLLYKANNINYDKCKLYYDFIITLNKLVTGTFLGDDVINKEGDIKNHFSWCISKIFNNFKKEKIIFDDTINIEEYFYNTKESFYRGGNMNVKDHQRYHSNSSSLSPAEITPLYESTTALRNLLFDGCKQTNDTTPDGKESVEVIITSPTILSTKESGDSKLSVE